MHPVPLVQGARREVFLKSEENAMPLVFMRKLYLQMFWRRAEKAGFTPESLYRMLVILNLTPVTLTLDEVERVLPYLNPLNARKFSYGKDERYGREKPPQTRQSVYGLRESDARLRA